MNTKNKKTIFFCFIILLFTLIFVLPVSARNNIALECKIDSFCGEAGINTSAQMLVDSDWDYDTKWEANDGANHPGEPHWIILDFESEKTFDSIKLVKASHGAADFGRTEFDAGGFTFEVSSDKQNWVMIRSVTGNGDEDIYEGSFEPVTARYLKLIITRPEQDEKSDENKPVRLYDIKVFETEYIADEDDEYLDDIFETEPVPVTVSTKVSPPTSDSPILFIAWVCMFIISLGIYSFTKTRKKYRRD